MIYHMILNYFLLDFIFKIEIFLINILHKKKITGKFKEA